MWSRRSGRARRRSSTPTASPFGASGHGRCTTRSMPTGRAMPTSIIRRTLRSARCLCQHAMPDRRHVVTCQDPRTWRDWRIELSCYLEERRYRSLLTWPYEDNPLVWRAVRRADAVFSEAKHIVPKARNKYRLKVAPQFLPNPVPLPDGPVAKADRPTVCFVGRFDKRKRPELFFELARRCPDVHFIAVGAANSARMDRHAAPALRRDRQPRAHRISRSLRVATLCRDPVALLDPGEYGGAGGSAGHLSRGGLVSLRDLEPGEPG